MAEVLISLHVANDGFDGRVRRRSRLMMPKPRFRPEMKTRRKARCRYNCYSAVTTNMIFVRSDTQGWDNFQGLSPGGLDDAMSTANLSFTSLRPSRSLFGYRLKGITWRNRAISRVEPASIDGHDFWDLDMTRGSLPIAICKPLREADDAFDHVRKGCTGGRSSRHDELRANNGPSHAHVVGSAMSPREDTRWVMFGRNPIRRGCPGTRHCRRRYRSKVCWKPRRANGPNGQLSTSTIAPSPFASYATSRPDPLKACKRSASAPVCTLVCTCQTRRIS